MTNKIEAKGKNLDEAKKAAALELGVDVDDILYEILENATSGFFGINAKPCIISAWLEDDGFSRPIKEKKPVPVKEKKKVKTEAFSNEDSAKAEEFLGKVLSLMNINAEFSVSKEEDTLNIEVKGENMGAVIGRRGETLDALQYLTSIVVNKGKDDYTKISLDAENYRKKRADALEKLANKVADKVIKNRRNFTLEPMNPFERRVIHSTLQSNNMVTTYSVGEEPNRRVVVSLSK